MIRTLERPRETWAQRREFDCNVCRKHVSVEHVQGYRHETRRNMSVQQNGCIQSMLPEANRALERSF